jgi:TatD DNase family protein
MQKFEYFDIHSHFNDQAFDIDLSEMIEQTQNANIGTIVVGTDRKLSKKAVEIAAKTKGFYAAVGLHPTDTDEEWDDEFFQNLVTKDKVVAVGECGLDYYNMKEDTPEERRRQRQVFESQLELAVKHNKPLMIHCRDAHGDLLPILESKKREYGDKLRGNVHFFTASTEIAKRYFDLNFTISFTGVLTFTHDYDDVVKFAPSNMIMAETDAPYVAPVPYRGKRNVSLYVSEVVKKIAQLRGQTLERTKKDLVENAVRVFALD